MAVVFSFALPQEVESYYIYSDYFKHGIPTGFMGEKDGKSMKIDINWKDKPFKGDNCMKITTDNSEAWRGLHIQFTGAWNVSLRPDQKLADLSTYEKLEFYARAEETEAGPYILPEIGVGGGGGELSEEKVSDTFLEIGTDWKKYSINIKGADLARVNTLLYMVLPTGTIYLDEIRFVKKIKN
jgi:hypothetical protein